MPQLPRLRNNAWLSDESIRVGEPGVGARVLRVLSDRLLKVINGALQPFKAPPVPEVQAPQVEVVRLVCLVYGLAGRPADAQNAPNGLLQLQRRQPSHQSVNMACVATAYLSVGNNEQALSWLEQAYKEQPNVLTSLRVDPIYDPLRSDPRFKNLLQRGGQAE